MPLQNQPEKPFRPYLDGMGAIHITVDGVPVETVIAEQESAEVEITRRCAIADVSFGHHIVSKQRPTKVGKRCHGKAKSVVDDPRVLASMFVSGSLTTADLLSVMDTNEQIIPMPKAIVRNRREENRKRFNVVATIRSTAAKFCTIG